MSSAAIFTISLPTIDDLFASCHQPTTSAATVVISLIGAGGKTSTLNWLAEAAYQRGSRVLITTTTRMYLPPPDQYPHLLIDADPQHYRCALAALPPGPLLAALFSHCNEQGDKVIGLTLEEIDQLKSSGLFDLILVEADGSHQLPLKAAAGHEPCIPVSSDVVIAVTGREVIARPAQPSRIHRWEIFSALTGAQPGDPLDAAVFAAFIAHPQGMFTGCPAAAQRVWLINRFYQSDSSLLPTLSQLFSQQHTLSALWLGAVQEQPHCLCCLTRTHC